MLSGKNNSYTHHDHESQILENYRIHRHPGDCAMLSLSLVLNRDTSKVQKSEVVFTGGKACIECHQKEYRLWKGSDHDKAMSVASDTSVLGNFNNAEFSFNGRHRNSINGMESSLYLRKALVGS